MVINRIQFGVFNRQAAGWWISPFFVVTPQTSKVFSSDRLHDRYGEKSLMA